MTPPNAAYITSVSLDALPALHAAVSEQRTRVAEVESTAISHRAEAASLYRQAESFKQEATSLRQEVASSRDSHRTLEAELRADVIGMRAEADATIEALRMQLAAAANKLKRLVGLLFVNELISFMFSLSVSYQAVLCSSSVQFTCKSRVSLCL